MSNQHLSDLLLAGMISLLVSTTADANIVYEVNRTVGSSEITGYIETDGTLGTIGRTAVTDWNLNIFSFFGPTAEVMTPSDSDLIFLGTGFQTTATHLVFDFSQLDSIGFIGITGARWCLGGADGNCISPSTEVLQTSLGMDNEARAGPEIIGISSVPVPAAVWLFGTGLIGLAGAARRSAA